MNDVIIVFAEEVRKKVSNFAAAKSIVTIYLEREREREKACSLAKRPVFACLPAFLFIFNHFLYTRGGIKIVRIDEVSGRTISGGGDVVPG